MVLKGVANSAFNANEKGKRREAPKPQKGGPDMSIWEGKGTERGKVV